MPLQDRLRAWGTPLAIVLAASLAAIVIVVLGPLRGGSSVPSFRSQACSLPASWLTRVQRGHYPPRQGEIEILPKPPAYVTHKGGGWPHSGPWPYLQRVPLVFYGPGIIPARGEVDVPATMADVAPTLATLLRGSLQTDDGRSLDEVITLRRALKSAPPRVIVTIVWDGGGWNVLEKWADAWPNLERMMAEGVSYPRATIGSSPSVTPAVHTTLGTGVWPRTHGVPAIKVRDEGGKIVDVFLEGESSRFIKVPTLAERWDEQNDNRALVAMIGYEPWHLGMIGKGAEKPGGDKDDAVWLNVETNDWKTNPEHYTLPDAIVDTPGLEDDLSELDAADGKVDRAWGKHKILDDPARIEETPAFIRYHQRAMERLIRVDGYGDDRITDLLFTNFKQIDRVGHYFNMRSDEVRESVEVTDDMLGRLETFLDEEVGRGKWVIVVTADHGQQPDAEDVDGYGIAPEELHEDIEARFGPILDGVVSTELFLDMDAMSERGITVAEVARFVGGYRLRDNTKRPDMHLTGAGVFAPDDRLFDLAIPSSMLPDLDCAARR